MNRMSIPTATIVWALFGLVSVGRAGEMTAEMEEMKGEAKAAVEEAKGNKVQAEVERAKGKVKELKAKTE